MFDVATNILALIFVLGVMIFVHEFGHFAAARLFGIRVEVFAFGFGPRLFGFKRGHTDYRVCALPLGGYVKMKGENPDEALAGDADEYLTRPKWQRFIVLIMGPAMNVVLAVALFTVVYMVGIQVETYKEDPVVIGWVVPGSPAEGTDLARGDRIVAVDGEPVFTWREFEIRVLVSANQPLTLTIDGVGGERRVDVTLTSVGQTEQGWLEVRPDYPPLVGPIAIDSPAERAGIQTGDRMLAVNGQPVESFYDVTELIGPRANLPTEMTLERDGQQLTISVVPGPAPDDESVGRIGVYRPFITEARRYGPLAAISQSLTEVQRQTALVAEILARLFTGRMSVKTLSGPIEIARISGGVARTGDPVMLLSLMAVISLQLGILNLLPIPILDGGHLAVILFEGLIRRDLSLRVKERMMQVGFILLVTLMAVVITFDVIKSMPSGWQGFWPF